eukprot:CAMPEP_0182610318 /NCGR_PEP_ID=MMETSP1330-20130603/7331_1 /TAXON_ID=464278 /ORGANISM="Picochlorum sp., Strain RCC944" /LENGTH=44 /DNA_ID= /DNA_START= /DNA_END= /DNA_ORIENTATION=
MRSADDEEHGEHEGHEGHEGQQRHKTPRARTSPEKIRPRTASRE